MREENKKEILTREIIKKEIKHLYFANIRFTLIILSIFIICMFGLRFTTEYMYKDIKHIEVIFLLVTVVICILSMACTGFYKNVKYFYKASRDEFKIVIDSVVYGIPGKHRTKFEHESSSYKLFFSSYAEYEIPGGMNYKWSKEFCMFNESIYNGAIKGDEFYLAVIDNKEIPIAYSKKHFELYNDIK